MHEPAPYSLQKLRLCVPLCFCLLCSLLLNACSDPPEAYVEKANALLEENPGNVDKPIAILSEGLERFPDNTQLLFLRGNYYCHKRDFAACRADSTRLLELKPDRIEVRSLLCLLDEYEGVDELTNSECYQQVATMYEKKYAFSPDALHSQEFNYVIMLLLARHPAAEDTKKAFLAKADAQEDSLAWVYHHLLDTFDRTRFIKELFSDTGLAGAGQDAGMSLNQ